MAGPMTISVDTGGTFTDLVLAEEGQLVGLYKALTTPHDLFEGIAAAIEKAASAQGTSSEDLLGQTEVFVYATTQSTNAILESKVARTGLIVTRGHRDILLYKEGGKDQVHDWARPFPKPYVPRRLTFELTERVLSDGGEAIGLDEEEARGIVRRLGELEVDAIAVCLLWSPTNPAHELRVGELIEEVLPGVEYSLSHRVNRIIREYRRASATAIDASLKPSMRRHLVDLDARLRGLGFDGEPLMVTHVSGGVLRLDQIVEQPIQTIDSGPALAPVAGRRFQEEEQEIRSEDVLVVDTGGTSFDASLIVGGRIAYTREKWIGDRWYGHMTGLPAVDTRSIGAGGGSIAFVDAGGLLHVGPESAGAEPGPAAYGRGGVEPTVTDAALVLGYLNPDNFLGGQMALDVEAARRAIAEQVGGPLGIDPEAAAEAVLIVASEVMRGLLIDMTVAQGRDARNCLMVAGGGAAGLNIVRIAREAGVRQIVIPRLAAGLSAIGGQYSDITANFSRSRHTVSSSFDYEGVNAALGELDAEIESFLDGARQYGETERRFFCEARYDQQMWEIEVDLGARDQLVDAADLEWLQDRFDAEHLKLFAVNQPRSPIEIVTWRGEARVVRRKPNLVTAAANRDAPTADAAATRAVYFGGETLTTEIRRGERLHPGASFAGPAVIEEDTTTIVVPPGASVDVRPSHYLVEVGTDVD